MKAESWIAWATPIETARIWVTIGAAIETIHPSPTKATVGRERATSGKRVEVSQSSVIQTPKLAASNHAFELADHEWAAIDPMLPNKPRGVRRPIDRRVLNGIFWVLRSGPPRRDLPNAFGPYTTSYNLFVRWPSGFGSTRL